MSRRKAAVQPKRTAEHQSARQQRHTLKDGIVNAVKELRVAQDALKRKIEDLEAALAREPSSSRADG
mgnify:CR=1 FL=1